ncbi:MAG: BatA and WFA domain-containing protein [Phycisphaerales bacterium]
MSFLSPGLALLFAGITIPLLVSLYFLKLRRRMVTVSSTLLWKKAIREMQVNSPFQRMRRSLLLLLQLLILGALLFAMARPTMETIANPGQRVVIVIDHSGSMNATDVSPTRLDEAKKAALDLIDSMGAGGDNGGGASSTGETSGGGGTSGGAMVVSFAQNAQVRQTFTNDPVLLRDAVKQIDATDQVSMLEPALRLIEPYAARSSADDSEGLVVYIISDGRVREDGRGLSLAGATLKYIPIGGGPAGNAGAADPDNVGIVSFSARRDFDKPEIVQVFARVANYGSEPVKANLSLSLDGKVTRVQPVSLGAAPAVVATGPDAPATPTSGYETSVQFDFVLPGTALLELSHDHADQLPVDDKARLTLAPARRLRVLLVTEGNAFLARGIQSAGVRQLAMMTPAKFEDQAPESLSRGGWEAAGTSGLAGEGFDVIVFDGYSPTTTPLVDSLYFAAAPPIEGIRRIPSAEEDKHTSERILYADDSHPLLRYVVLDDVILSGPGRLEVSPQATVLATGQSGPIMAEIVQDGVRHVVASFDVLQSNWPIKISFPVFLGNTMQTLGLGGMSEGAGVAYRTGEVVSIPADTGDSITYTGPETLTVRRTQGAAVLPPLARAGIYTTDAKVQPPYDRLGVNLLDADESDLRTAGVLNVSTVAGDTTAQRAGIRREVWRWFVWGALGVMLLEWLVYTRRMHL